MIGISLSLWRAINAGVIAAISKLNLEDGDDLLQENGALLLLED